MIRVGTVNIDTSHPMGFAEVMEKSDRARYVGIYNDSFRSDAEVEGFMRRFGVEKRCQTVEELADMCDIGFIQGCNWDKHLDYVQPFFERKKPVFIDKPIVGSLKDCKRVEQFVADGCIILGSSSARYAFEVQEFMNRPVEERGEIVQIFGTCGVDEFNYGIHIAELAGGILGTGIQYVRYIGRSQTENKYCESYYIQFSNGKSFIYNVFTGTWHPFAITVMTTKTTYQFTIDSNRLYEALIEQICNYMEGKENLLVPAKDILESVRIMLAGIASREKGGIPVALDELTEEGPSFDGNKFWNEYSAASGPMYANLKRPGDE